MGEVFRSIGERHACWQQQGIDVDAKHGEDDHKTRQQRRALAGGDDRSRYPVIQATLQQVDSQTKKLQRLSGTTTSSAVLMQEPSPSQ